MFRYENTIDNFYSSEEGEDWVLYMSDTDYDDPGGYKIYTAEPEDFSDEVDIVIHELNRQRLIEGAE